MRIVCLASVASAALIGACSGDEDKPPATPPTGDDAGADVTQNPDGTTGEDGSTNPDVVTPDAEVDGGPKCKTSSCALSIAAGPFHTCALLGDHTVKCWGDNSHGELGTGALDAGVMVPIRSIPLLPVDNLNDAVAIAAGGEPNATGFTCAIQQSGAVRCWGSNTQGELGGPADAAAFPQGTTVPADASAAAIDLGYRHGCMLDVAGSLRCWGSNSSSARGNPALSAWVLPTDAGLATLSVGFYSNCVTTTSGQLICTGTNTNGQSDPASAANPSPPAVIDAGGPVSAASSGTNFACADVDGGVTCWGVNTGSQLGRTAAGTKNPPGSPDFAPGIPAAHVAAGYAHSCAIMADRSVACWGANSKGQSGDFVPKSAVTTPFGVGGIGKIVQLAIGFEHSCALNDDGAIFCWGSHAKGQLGPNGNPGTPPPDAGPDGGDAGQGTDGGVDNVAHPDPVSVPL